MKTASGRYPAKTVEDRPVDHRRGNSRIYFEVYSLWCADCDWEWVRGTTAIDPADQPCLWCGSSVGPRAVGVVRDNGTIRELPEHLRPAPRRPRRLPIDHGGTTMKTR
jgi:hypothetical protein